jgi:hypothetical protein
MVICRGVLESVENPSDLHYPRAYVYSCLIFLAKVFKAQLELQHRWLARRATVRVRSELMAAIYEKALKRKDYSGLVKKEDPEAKKEASHDKKTTSTTTATALSSETSTINPQAGNTCDDNH